MIPRHIFINLLAYFLISNFALAADNVSIKKLIQLTPEQEKSMGIVTSKAVIAQHAHSQKVAAEVVVPVGQERILSAPQAGLIDQLMVASGQSVKQGEVMAHLSSPELLALQRDHLQALSQQKLSQNSYQRDNELYQDGIIAERRYLATQSQHEQNKVLLEERRQALRLSGMSDVSIQQMEKTGQYSRGITMNAPISGVVIEQMVTAGQRVDINTPLYRIAQLNSLWLEMHVPTNILPQIQLNMPIQATVTNGNSPSQIVKGEIIAIVPNMNKQEQTVLVRALIKQNTAKLNPGQMLEAEFIQPSSLRNSSTSQLYSVAKTAIIYIDGIQSYIFVKKSGGYQLVAVKVLGEDGPRVNIQANISTEAEIAISGTSLLKAKAMQ